jgi:hypothetical protein
VNDPKSTTEIRLISVDVVKRQAETCAARREHLSDRIAHNSEGVDANTKAITELTVAMAKQTTAFTSSIDVLKVRLTISAAVGGSLPVIVVLIWQYFTNR